jgi:5-methylcytosine-specific restriction endonuclease McrA
MKRCTACHQEGDFGKNRRYPDGLQRVCKKCWNTRGLNWRRDNIDRARATERLSYHKRLERDETHVRNVQRAYKRKHTKSLRIKHAIWRKGHLKERAEAQRRWRFQNPEKRAATDAQKRANRRSAKGHATAEQIAARAEVWGNRCWMCKGPYETNDHVIPLARGGTHGPSNIRPACSRCNPSKGARWYPGRNGRVYT